MSKDFEHIVIGGQQRSGTSLFRALLGSHSKISIFQWDLPLWLKFSEIYANRVLTTKQKKKLVSDVLSHKKVELSDFEFHESEFDSLITNSQTESDSFFCEFYQLFLELNTQKGGREISGIKTPENEFFTKNIFSSFPKTKFIHVIRNPLDVAVSLKGAKERWWGGKINYFSHIRLWETSAQKAAENLKNYPNQYLVVKYEDLVENKEETMKRVCSFLHIDFEPEMLNMNKQPGWTGTNSSFQKTNTTNVKSSNPINRYKKQLPELTQNIYFNLLNKYLTDFGYETKSTDISWNNKAKYSFYRTLDSLTEKFIRIIRRSFLYTTVKRFVPNKEQ